MLACVHGDGTMPCVHVHVHGDGMHVLLVPYA